MRHPEPQALRPLPVLGPRTPLLLARSSMTTNSASLQTEVPGRTAQSPERRASNRPARNPPQEGVHGPWTGGHRTGGRAQHRADDVEFRQPGHLTEGVEDPGRDSRLLARHGLQHTRSQRHREPAADPNDTQKWASGDVRTGLGSPRRLPPPSAAWPHRRPSRGRVNAFQAQGLGAPAWWSRPVGVPAGSSNQRATSTFGGGNSKDR